MLPITMATIAEIKLNLGYSVLNLNTALDKDNQPTEWMRHWDNSNRVAVSLHKDTLAKIKANPNMPNLVLQQETKSAAQGDYKAIRIVAVAEAETTL
jgi:hypothetical protein